MTALAFLLLPDARESGRPLAVVNTAIRELNNVSGAQYHAPFHPVWTMKPFAWRSLGGAIDPDTMLGILRSAQWDYPARVMYRFEDENTWSFVTLGLSLKPELGED